MIRDLLLKGPSPWAATAGLVISLAIVALLVGHGHAQAQHADIPILVVGEDEDKTSVKRSSDIFKRVLSELKISMHRHGFRMVDEESVAADLDWEIRDRRPKLDIIRLAKLMTKSGKASARVRAVVLFRIHAAGKDLGGATDIRTRIDGEVYDIASNRFIDGFEMPTKNYGGPAGCSRNKVCIESVVGDKAREIAAGLGDILGKKLVRYRGESGTRVSGGGDAVTGGGTSRSCGDLLTPYTVKLRYFNSRAAQTVIGVMADEFPCYRSHTLLEKSSVIRAYEYQTTAKPHKLEEWLTILLIDMNFDVDNEVNIHVDGTEIMVDKIVKTPDRPISEDEKSRFN